MLRVCIASIQNVERSLLLPGISCFGFRYTTAYNTRMIGLPYGGKNYDDTLSHFHPIPQRNGRTDGQICYINIKMEAGLYKL